jgi:CRISPR/Cas system-associated exonuclease Cas4 (RecB family)
MTYFLEDIAHYLFGKTHGNFQQTIIIFPNRRAQLFFNEHLSHLSDKPIWAPDYFTISEFIWKLSGLQVADQLTLLFRLFKVFKEVSGSNETFDTFYYYCEMLLSDFDDIDKYRVDARAVFKNIAELKSMEDLHGYLDEIQLNTIRQFWEVFSNAKDSSEKNRFLNLWDRLYEIYDRFGIVLTAEGLAYEGMAYRKAVDNLKADTHNFWSDKQLVFIGFNALNRSEEILFDRFRNLGNTLFFWDYNEAYIKNELHEAGLFLRKYINRYPQPLDFELNSEIDGNPEIKTLAVPSNIAQAKTIDYCLQELHASIIDKPSQTAIVMADERLLAPLLNSMPASIDKINISMGYPVIDTPVFSFISSLNDLHRNKKIPSAGEDTYLYYHKDIFNLLKHSYFNTLISSRIILSFEEKCRKSNTIFINPSELGLDHPIIDMIFQPISDPNSLGRYLREIVESIAVHLIGPDQQTEELAWQIEVLHRVHQVLMQFESQLSDSGLIIQFPTALSLLRKVLSGITVPFSGEPLSGLQIMGILETRALDFENLIILSMNEGKFPKTGQIPSFIPFALREGFGLPTIRHQDAIYAYYFYRLLHRSKQVILVYNTKSEGLQKGEPSRYILQLNYESGRKLQHTDMGYRISSFPVRVIRGMHTEEVSRKLQKYIRSAGSSFLSPSAIISYLKCKLRFYFRYIEEIEEPENIEEQVEANVFGSIVHKAMAILYDDLVGKTAISEQISAIAKDVKGIEMAINKAFADEYFHKTQLKESDFHGRNIIVKKVIKKYIKGILDFDSIHSPQHLISLEKRYNFYLPLDEKGTEVGIGGFVDRLDEKDGLVRVIDYKTGEKNNSFGSIEQLFSEDRNKRNDAVLQTFLYAYMVLDPNENKPVQPSLFFVREIFKPTFDHRVQLAEDRKKFYVTDFRTLAPEFKQHLVRLLTELFNSEIPFLQTADTENCKACPYNAICKRKV